MGSDLGFQQGKFKFPWFLVCRNKSYLLFFVVDFDLFQTLGSSVSILLSRYVMSLLCSRFEPFFAITPMKISHEHELIYPYITNQISQATSAIFNCDLLSLPYGTFNKFLQMDVLYKCE